MPLRILFADDQLPDDHIVDAEVLARIGAEYPGAQPGFVRAFTVMRRIVKALREQGHDVTVARRLADAISLAQDQHFDVAIIDLGWYADRDVDRADAPTAGWTLTQVIDAVDAEHPERPATAQIMYSARFARKPEISVRAASGGKLPFFKPYQELDTIPLSSEDDLARSGDRVEAGCHSLHAAVAFVEHLLRAQERSDRDPDAVRRALRVRSDRALEREASWDRLARVLAAVGILLVLAGAVAAMLLGAGEGAVTAMSGAVVTVISKLMYGELRNVRTEIEEATRAFSAGTTDEPARAAWSST